MDDVAFSDQTCCAAGSSTWAIVFGGRAPMQSRSADEFEHMPEAGSRYWTSCQVRGWFIGPAGVLEHLLCSISSRNSPKFRCLTAPDQPNAFDYHASSHRIKYSPRRSCERDARGSSERKQKTHTIPQVSALQRVKATPFR